MYPSAWRVNERCLTVSFVRVLSNKQKFFLIVAFLPFEQKMSFEKFS
jgi:hypothetical protein